MKNKSLQEQVDNLSDEFQSTFSILSENVLANMFHENEKNDVAQLIKKHLGASHVHFEKSAQFSGEPYALWIIKWR